LCPFWCGDGGPLNRKIAVWINGLLLKIGACGFAWGVFDGHGFGIRGGNKSDFLIIVAL